MLLTEQAPAGGLGRYGHHYNGGEFLPFYVPRDAMPQVDDLPAMIADALGSVHIDVARTPDLRAHQRISHRAARAMPEHVKRFPIVVSSDGYVIDGNHRWWAAVHDGREFLSTIRLDMPFDAAIAWLADKSYVTHQGAL